MKGLRKILRVSSTAKETNEWVLNKAGVLKRELLDTVKARKLAYYGHTMRKQRSCPEKEIMQGTSETICPPADGSSTRGGSTSVRGRVRSPHTAKLQAARVPIAYGSCAPKAAAPWD